MKTQVKRFFSLALAVTWLAGAMLGLPGRARADSTSFLVAKPGQGGGTTEISVTLKHPGDSLALIVSKDEIPDDASVAQGLVNKYYDEAQARNSHGVALLAETWWVTGGSLGTYEATVLGPYTSGSDIGGTVAAPIDYGEVVELNGSGRVVALYKVRFDYPSFNTGLAAVVGPGRRNGTTEITGLNYPGDSLAVSVAPGGGVFVYTLVQVGLSAPPGGTTPYRQGTDLGPVAPGDRVIAFEVNGQDIVTGWSVFTLTSAEIGEVPGLASLSARPGRSDGSTEITVTPNHSGDSLAVQVSSAPMPVPDVGDWPPASKPGTRINAITGGTGITTTSLLINPYVSGSDIGGALPGDYAGVFELDGSGRVAAFSQFQLTGSSFNPGLAATAGPGRGSNTTEITATLNHPGDTLAVQVQAGGGVVSYLIFKVGDPAPGGITPYQQGSDLGQVTPGDYVRVYELNGKSQVMGYTGIQLTADEIHPSLVTETLTVKNPETGGFTVDLSPAVDGLTAGNFTILDSSGHQVGITAAATGDGGASYSVAAALTPGSDYTVTAVKDGYDFGRPTAVDVPNAQVNQLPVPLSSLTAGDTVRFAGYSWIVLDPEKGYLLMANPLSQTWPVSPTFDPNDPNSIAYYLNSTFDEGLPPEDRQLIIPHTWEPGETCNVGLLSVSEYQEYVSILGGGSTGGAGSLAWWLRDIATTEMQTVAGYVVEPAYEGAVAGTKVIKIPPDSEETAAVRPALYLNPATPVYEGTVTPETFGTPVLTVVNGVPFSVTIDNTYGTLTGTITSGYGTLTGVAGGNNGDVISGTLTGLSTTTPTVIPLGKGEIVVLGVNPPSTALANASFY